MILALLLAQATAPPSPRPPQDWAVLPEVRFVVPPTVDARLSRFVRGESVAGRCTAAVPTPEGWTLKVDFAVLVGGDGRPRTAVPRAIGCPTVEQYAAGALSRMLRADTIHPPTSATDTWNKTTLVFIWAE